MLHKTIVDSGRPKNGGGGDLPGIAHRTLQHADILLSPSLLTEMNSAMSRSMSQTVSRAVVQGQPQRLRIMGCQFVWIAIPSEHAGVDSAELFGHIALRLVLAPAGVVDQR